MTGGWLGISTSNSVLVVDQAEGRTRSTRLVPNNRLPRIPELPEYRGLLMRKQTYYGCSPLDPLLAGCFPAGPRLDPTLRKNPYPAHKECESGDNAHGEWSNRHQLRR